ncbi:MAG: aminotransferase class III-fold pyridoxal phosphate-dependent enzyme [Phycisphaerales bacterium]|jgi:acetylornithine aminotransferase|nr:aminotransferase class III-fold pyridoxal phosphate-dependent enzyme [Phycisphaerales bacterium]
MSDYNAAVGSACRLLMQSLAASNADINDIRPGEESAGPLLAEWADRLADVRGRPGFYPTIGSGRGKGALVELMDGSVKWDMITGIGVHGFGHGDLDLMGVAAQAAVQDTVMQGNLQCNTEAVRFAERLRAAARAGGADMGHCYPACSGAMANENALKVCMQARDGAPRVIAFQDNFIGRTVTLSHIGDSPGHREGVPQSIEVDLLPFWDPADPDGSSAEALDRLRSILAAHPEGHSCFVMELVQGEGGFTPAPRSFFVPLLETAREAGVLIWFDEIQTFGRTDRMFRFEGLDLGAYVDIVTVGKMTQGCAALWRAAHNPRPGLLSGTFLGSTVAMSVGTRILDRLASGGYYGPDGSIAGLHRIFDDRCRDIVERHPTCFPDVEGRRGPVPKWGGTGGMMRLTPFGGDRDAIASLVRRLFDAGVITFFCGHDPYHLRMLPPVGVLEPEHLESVMDIIETCVAAQGEDG